MTHDSAVRTVVKLVPEIEKRGAAAVLTEHAAKEDLPPAQLEKLAQVFNTLTTVSHIDNAEEADRGATVPLVDVPKLVMDYATGAGRVKAAAAPLSFSSHDPCLVDLNKALKFELRPELQKAAGDATGPREAAEEVYQRQITRDEAEAARLSVELDLQDEMSKLAGEIFSAAPLADDSYFVRDVSEFEEEALRRQPAGIVKAAGDYLEKFAAPHRTKLIRFDYSQPLVKYAYEIPHALGEKFAELASTLATFEIVKAASDDDFASIRAALQSPDANLDMSIAPGAADPDALPGGEAEDTAALLEQIQQDPTLTAGTEQKRTPSKDSSGSGGGGGDKKGGGDHSKKDGVGSKAIGLIAAPLSAVGGAVTGAAAKADEMLHQIVSKERDNKPQRAADMSVEDIRRAMNVRRLIGTDPVLKEADPKLVLEVYNSLAARNPDLAGDMTALRLILREAVSYEGPTLDSQKMLTEIRRNSTQGQKESDELDKKRYAVGGANPLSVAKTSKA